MSSNGPLRSYYGALEVNLKTRAKETKWRVYSKGIKKVLPDACHCMCSWHLQWNTFTNVHIKDFTNTFARCMFMWRNPKEFEKAWHEMVEKLGLNGNRWVTKIYAKYERWVEAYLRENFFGWMRSTQICESMNAYINRFFKIGLWLYEFVQQFDRAIMRIRKSLAWNG